MLSKNTIKRITRLAKKKYRQRENLFVAEGVKVISELLDSHFELVALYVEAGSVFAKVVKEDYKIPYTAVDERELSKATFLKTAQTAIAIFKIPPKAEMQRTGLTLVLDDVRDPGNLGTILRLCDWFGVEQLVCSPASVDCYNPKVVQASMGSLGRVNVIYTDLQAFLSKESRAIYGTFMTGENIYMAELPSQAIIIMGNEANGISEAVGRQITNRLAIPRFGKQQVTESLNVAMAASICLSEFKRGSH